MTTRVSVVGLGRLGLPLVAALASRGLTVVGYDAALGKVAAIGRSEFPFEPELAETLAAHAVRIDLAADLDAIRTTDLTFVVVPTPSARNGTFVLKHVEDALRRIGRILGTKADYHVVAVVSTVLPGDMQGLVAALENASGKRCGVDFGVCYNPAFIALGSVIHDFLNPDFVLIGESDARAGDALSAVHRALCPKASAVERMTFANAEVAKIALNTFVTMKISFANTLARICERLPGADADVVTRAIGKDRRVGGRYLKGAIGYGGPCFPRDNRAFSAMARRRGVRARFAEATDRINRQQVDYLAEIIASRAPKRATVAVLGLSYKPDTDVIEASQGIELAARLRADGYRVVVSDPLALELARAVLGRKVDYAPASEAAARADVVVITTPTKEFLDLGDADFAPHDSRRRVVVVDCWRLFAGRTFPEGVEYIPLGASLPEPPRARARRETR